MQIRRVRFDDLNVDYLRWVDGHPVGYQRQLEESRVREIVDDFDEARVGIGVVNQRSDGSLWTVDSNTRFEALRRLGHDGWDVMVHEGLTAAQEAALYYHLNHDRKMPNVWNKFGARGASGDPVVLAIIDLATEHGFKVGTADRSVHSIAAVGALESLYRLPDGPRLLGQTLQQIQHTWPSDAPTRDGVFIQGLAYFIYTWDGRYSEPDGPSIQWPRFNQVFGKVTGPEIQRACKALKVESGFAMNPITHAVAIRDIYNGRSTFSARLEGKVRIPRLSGGHKSFGGSTANRVASRRAS